MSDIPVLKIGDVLFVSIQTELNDRVATDLQESILLRIQQSRARALVIDISSLSLVDSYIGRVLTETARMALLMDTDVCLAGMQPAVAITMTEMGLGFPEVKTATSLELGLKRLGYRLENTEHNAVAIEEDDPNFTKRDPLDARN